MDSARRHRRLEAVLETFTDDQLAAAELETPHLRILAGAGSGKTGVLVARTASRVLRGTMDPDRSVVCTFSRAAATEVRARLEGLGVPVAAPQRRRGLPGSGVRVTTIHGWALRLVERHAIDEGAPRPALVDDRAALLEAAMASAAGAERATERRRELGAALGAAVSWAKARAIAADVLVARVGEASAPGGLPVELAAAGYAAYQEALARRRALDLDDLLLRAVELLRGDPSLAAATQWRSLHVAVDEFQDVNPAQLAFLELAGGGPDGDLVVVGDPNQAIYGWNGADPRLIDRWAADRPGTVTVELSVNFRSTPQIVDAGARVLGEALRGRVRSARGDGAPVAWHRFTGEDEEATHLSRTVRGWWGEGRDWSQIGVLARTNQLVAAAAGILRRAGVPVAGKGGGGVDVRTMHAAKGLEWPSVYLLGLEEGTLPDRRSVGADALAEERRLLYVATTRARDVLVATSTAQRSGRAVAPTRWVAPMLEEGGTGDGAGSAAGAAVADPVSVRSRLAELRSRLGHPTPDR